MIPQEVVARNRNRFLQKETPKRYNSESKLETKNESPTKDDDSDDGYDKIIFQVKRERVILSYTTKKYISIL